jgi:uncharacterized protein YndB with AHSA1/START domain/DNA-binding transcriptional ArsR family regulator
MDVIFKALSDTTRRKLLDRLRDKNGQSLSELENAMGMTRFGVMKHLKVLEAASLIVTHKSGRFKYHYLNPSPLQLMVDRWIEPLTQQPLTRAVLGLKAELERNHNMTKPDFMLETFIRTTPEKLWKALTDPALITRYHFASIAIHGRFDPGEAYEYQFSDGNTMLSGEVIAADPPSRLELSFLPGWMGPHAVKSRHVYKIEHMGDLTKLTVLHFDLPEGQDGVREGWAKIIASLKSYLETGKALHFATKKAS